ncbi:metal-dependent transcriptional regulator [Halorussus amylolyticus]|uniref:metal-dependent transcriptional regulator n=1 Tax=Halorussus amylolyticus TaxID=1126242 RepID=UPI001042D813|nr:metal-dependent transcriptional regulator [Halorussus amylolyticus]
MSEVTESVGRYLGTVHLLTANAGRRAKTGEVADAVGVSAASVTEMLATLEDRGLADYEKYEGVSLTDEGEATAREFLWRRCVAENFLEDDLELDVTEFADDPRAFGQALSDDAIHRLKEVINHPCNGKCSASHDEYSACSDDVRETLGDAEL